MHSIYSFVVSKDSGRRGELNERMYKALFRTEQKACGLFEAKALGATIRAAFPGPEYMVEMVAQPNTSTRYVL